MLLKIFFDRIIALSLLIFLMPLFIIIALLIKFTSKGPALFIQERAGQFTKAFNIYKFRTMIIDAEKIGDGVYTGENDPRITKIGKFLRKTSLDELPQLINIIKGDMSIVGPRPTLLYQVKQYDSRQKRRLQMKPGVTGWAQVNGRNSLSWPERIELDIWYVENWSLWLDVMILFKTIKVVLTREGVYAAKEKFIVKDEKELNI